jgi:hypothetical protein
MDQILVIVEKNGRWVSPSCRVRSSGARLPEITMGSGFPAASDKRIGDGQTVGVIQNWWVGDHRSIGNLLNKNS